MKKFFKREEGAVTVVEAAIVFPITIFIIIVFILFGNLLYQQARVDAVVTRGAQYMGNHFTDPILTGVKDSIPESVNDVQPYRFLFPSSSIERDTENFIRTELTSLNAGYFSGMEVKDPKVTCNLKNCVIYQQAEIQVEYTVWMPMSFFGMEPNMRFSSATTFPITCPEEFIRNIEMVDYYMETTGLKDKLETLKSKISDFF